ncbi:hypothetical protein I7I48_00913 [Histoplasma ohiense]|nr:hypothetical protein I7I48_00913 [Histoplasma ohiense (nom. inval.)]
MREMEYVIAHALVYPINFLIMHLNTPHNVGIKINHVQLNRKQMGYRRSRPTHYNVMSTPQCRQYT